MANHVAVAFRSEVNMQRSPLRTVTVDWAMAWVPRAALVGVSYFAAAKLGLSLSYTAQQVTLVWPPTGIALAAIL
jgi:integral membrane sensor domain MASE1